MNGWIIAGAFVAGMLAGRALRAIARFHRPLYIPQTRTEKSIVRRIKREYRSRDREMRRKDARHD